MSSNEFPREIAPSEVRVGDRIRVTDTNDDNELTESYEGIVSAVNVNGFIIGEARSRGFSFVSWDLTLLDRPVKRGPAFDAERGTVWFLHTDRSLWLKARSRLVSEHGRVLDPANEPELFAQMVPYVTELEALRSNVIEAARVWAYDYSNPRDELPEVTHLHAAVRALRDHQAGA